MTERPSDRHQIKFGEASLVTAEQAGSTAVSQGNCHFCVNNPSTDQAQS